MKRRWLLGLIGSVLMFGQSAAYSEAASPADMTQARSVVEAYLGALVQGDLASIRQLLGGTFLKKNEMLLNDAGYSAKLVEIYSSATYEITGLRGIRGGKVEVDVTLNIDPSSFMDKRLIVSKVTDASTQQERYLITGENSPDI